MDALRGQNKSLERKVKRKNDIELTELYSIKNNNYEQKSLKH